MQDVKIVKMRFFKARQSSFCKMNGLWYICRVPARYKNENGLDYVRKKSLYRPFSQRDISHLNFDNSQNFLLCNEDHAIAYRVFLF